MKKLSLVLPFALAVSACEPIGTSINGWPKEDQNLSRANLVEIERNLRRLGVFRGRVDGQITRITRNGIIRYQRSIGAPETGTVSARLVRSLRSSVANIQTRTQPRRTTTVRTTPRRPAATAPVTNTAPAPATVPDFSEGGDDGGGGGGGGDGGSWG